MEATKRVWKFPFEITDEVTIGIPAGFQMLSVQVQDGKPVLWALVDSDIKPVTITLYVYGTGHPINSPGKAYIGTIQLSGLVWHVFF